MKHKIANILGIILIIVFLPVAVVNTTLAVKGSLHPEKVATFLGWGPLIVETGSMLPAFAKQPLVMGLVVAVPLGLWFGCSALAKALEARKTRKEALFPEPVAAAVVVGAASSVQDRHSMPLPLRAAAVVVGISITISDCRAAAPEGATTVAWRLSARSIAG